MTALPVMLAAPLAVLCVVIIYMDLRHMRIPDWVSFAAVGLFVVWVVVDFGSVPILSRIITAGVVFVICFGLFAARIMGGGDTKVIPALSLFVPLATLSAVLVLFAMCLFASIALVLALRRFAPKAEGQWKVMTSAKLPMGLAIGTTGLVAIVASYV